MSEVDYNRPIIITSTFIVIVAILFSTILTPEGRLEQFLRLLSIVSMSAIVTDLTRVGINNVLVEIFDINPENEYLTAIWKMLFIVFTAVIGTGEGLVEDLYLFIGIVVGFLYFALTFLQGKTIVAWLLKSLNMFAALIYVFLTTLITVQRGDFITFYIVVVLALFSIVLAGCYEYFR